ncbi:T9SS type A sorting domain-containing protein [Xanthocytophaga agilis]|uniref:T9SS type A sorting domain-containing protein n=1 Tax=Xanthocytophaga agilis TaxID=3048010 RepID=A0AAE3R162_9BACT|nr:T9SS type A sorting domain-containing protein [Xanthocytophaga agilis]MDJ1499540.1 T9SS type A sorting domain-containing protein [Xanthocytophaga agilis]
MNQKFTYIFLSALAYQVTFGQNLKPEVINASGQKLQNGSFQLTYSVGEPLITVIKTQNDILTQGFIQPDVAKFGDNFNYYPNPVTDKLYLENADKIASYKVYDVLGREVFGHRFDQPQRQITINLETLAEAIFIINAFDKTGKRLYSFQVMKK